MQQKLFIYTDGGARGNPGAAAVGVMIKSELGKTIEKLFQTIGEATNNVAEYQAVITALEWLKNNQTIKQLSNQTMVYFYMDSKLVVNQLNGVFKVRDSRLRNLLLKIRMLEQEIGGQITYQYIPREKNKEADTLVNEALDNQY